MGDPTSIDRWANASLNRFLLRFWVTEERRGTMKTNETEVLTVGAGPVTLGEHGRESRQEWGGRSTPSRFERADRLIEFVLLRAMKLL